MKPEFPVRAKLQLATVAAVVAFGALNAFIVAKLQFATLEEEQQQRVAFAGRLLASRLVEPLLYGDRLAVQKLLEETRSLDESFFAILVFDAAGGLAQHSGLASAAQQPGMRTETFPILDGKLGSVGLVVSLAPLEAKVSRTLRWLVAMILLILVSGMGVAFLIARSVTKPVEQLVRFARTLDLDQVPRVDVRTSDELEELAQAFEAMAQRLSQLYRRATEHERAMARLEHLATVGTLAAGVAHEINNPLAGIRTGLERLVRRLPADEQTSRYSATLRDALGRIERAVQGLLRFARATEVKVEPVQLPEVVDRAWELAGACWQKGGLRLVQQLPGDLPPVRADAAKLQEVFLNLFLNACDAMGGQGSITVTAEQVGREVRVTVSDTGPGVPEELRERIFLPFFTTKGNAGTGLGLAVSRAALQEMGGDLLLLPRTPGAHFQLVLEVATP